MDEPTKYFQVGFKRCGTTSLWAFFNRNGIPAVHFDWGRLGRRMERNLSGGLPPLSGYERFDAFTHMEYSTPRHWFDGFRRWPELMETYENSRFILNTRSRESWVRSMLPGNPEKRYWRMEYFEARWGTSDPDQLREIWLRDWAEHHRSVMAGIPEDRLLVFDIERDSPELLCEFIGLPSAAARHWTRENARLHPLAARLAAKIPVPVKRMIPDRMVLPIKQGLRRR